MEIKRKEIAVIGLWHLGWTVGASLAEQGYKVTGFDYDKQLVADLKIGKLPLFEPGLTELTVKNLETGRLDFSNDFKELKNANYIVLTYDTPVDEKDRVNLDIIFKAVDTIKKHVRSGSTLIIMSQVPVGTSRKIYSILGKKVEVIYNPENIRLGDAIKTFIEADRMVIGVSTKRGVARMRNFYKFFKNDLQFMSLESAEMVKHSINAFLACSISFINQITAIAEAVGANMNDVSAGLRSDLRIGQKARVSPGLGFAGGTLGRDVQVLLQKASEYKIDLSLVAHIYKVNQSQYARVVEKIKRIIGSLAGKKIAILGLVYKPGTSSLRRSFSLEVAKILKNGKAKVSAFDPALHKPSKETAGLELAKDAYEAVSNADLVVILTEWEEFKNLNFGRLKKLMKKPVFYDAKNILNMKKMIKLGFNYYGTGISRENL